MINWRSITLIAIPVTAIITAMAYEPVSIAIYKIAEPHFACPLNTDPKCIAIRSDALGGGEFGAKRRNGHPHAGIDIQAPVNTPVYASKSGIAFCGNVPTGYGKYVMIYHPDGFVTMYSHLSNWTVRSTQRVRKGQLIGFVGKTGNSASKYIQPHLHFEIRKDGTEPQDPKALMK